jgi:hypothetical protein
MPSRRPDSKPVVRPANESNLPATTSQQLALDLFAGAATTFGARSIKGTKDGQQIIFEKSQVLISTGTVGLKARQLINVCHYLGSNDPRANSYSVPYAFFKWMLGTTTRDNKYIVSLFMEAQDIKISVINESTRKAVLTQMIGDTVFIEDGMIHFTIPALVRQELASPKVRALVNMRVSADFQSQYSLALYELLAMRDRPGQTEWLTVEEWKRLLGCAGQYEEFKSFKQKVLDTAIAEINKRSDIEVKMHRSRLRGGATVTHILFEVKDNEKARPDVSRQRQKEVAEEFQALTNEFGLSDKEIDGIIAKKASGEWPHTRISNAIEFARFRIRHGTVTYPGKLFMSALENGNRLSVYEREKPGPDASESGKSVKEMAMAAAEDQTALEIVVAAKMARARLINPHDHADVQAMWKSFQSSVPGKAILARYKLQRATMSAACEIDVVAASFWNSFLKRSIKEPT